MIARLRYLLLPLGLASLICGIWAGLLRFGWDLPSGRANLIEMHGPLLVFGFLGTVISLERAVALRRAWGYLAPAGTVVGTVLLFAGVRQGIGQLVLLLAGCVLLVLFGVILHAHATGSTATLALGALLWIVGTALWLADLPFVKVVPWWAGFLVLTIVGERLELAAMSRLDRIGRLTFALLTATFLTGLVVSTADASTGIRIAGAAFVGYALWLAHYDIARHTVRRTGLPRFVAVALLAGYVWLAIGGVLWLRDGAAIAGFGHDAELHAIFLGFVFSMIFGHAPVIFPGVLGIRIPYRRFFYVHLSLLHAGLVLRVGGDLTESFSAARRGGLLNAIAIVLFLLATVGSAALAVREARARRVPLRRSEQPVGSDG